MDFYQIKTQEIKKNGITLLEVYPDFIVGRSTDLMVQGKSFYAVWDEAKNLWSTDEYDVQRLVDEDLDRYIRENRLGEGIYVRYMRNFSSNSWKNFRNFMANVSDSARPLDDDVTFADQEIKKTDYASKRLSYGLEEGPTPAYDTLINTLYSPEEREKLEWAIGSILAGDAKDIQKFLVLYGAAGHGKSTWINIVQMLFQGYYTTFEAKALTASSNAFATEVFRSNPLVAIQHDGDLSKIEDNTKLNSIVSHEEMTMNEKYKPSYMARINAFLIMGTNKPVKITDSKSGIIRRLIDVQPTGNRVSSKEYFVLMKQIEFELGRIARKCLEQYHAMGKNYYANYRPVEMILQTDVFFNFMESYYDVFNAKDGTSLNHAYDLYKAYCEDSNIEYKLAKYKFREELKNYFTDFHERITVDGIQIRSYYSGFIKDQFLIGKPVNEEVLSIDLDAKKSLLDDILKDQPAQYANSFGTPTTYWSEVTTTLRDIDTSKMHFVKVPKNHIVIDFDLKDENGEKSLSKNLDAAAIWPSTYTELSKSGHGVHLHYIYDGDDVEDLSPVYDDGIEVKVYKGDSALRRLYSASNGIAISHISTGLPKKEKKMIDVEQMAGEKSVRKLIERSLRKEIHPNTKSNVDFIFKVLTDAQNQGIKYDVRDLAPRIMAFANNSSNQADYCIKRVSTMPFYSIETTDFDGKEKAEDVNQEKPIVFFDVEVYPNLFYISWKYEGANSTLVHMFNPSPQEVEELLQMRLVGFHNRGYDNHILYARYMGFDNAAIYALSQDIINSKDFKTRFVEAYNLSYTDVYDFTSKKQSLKKYELELGIRHMELDIPWDEPVPEEKWSLVAEYCDNDVLATEAVWNARKQDFAARQILSDLSGLTVNDGNRAHATRIMFGRNRSPQNKFNYTSLADGKVYNGLNVEDRISNVSFPGYIYNYGKSTYKNIDVGEGGFVYAEPGMYKNVVVLDIASMHPTSIIELDLFGEYTKTFKDILDARLAIKHGDFSKARKMLGGKLAPYLENEDEAAGLANALKLIINSVYGFTAASFPNPFRDDRNKDNIVAKRGALFMVDLLEAVQAQGYTVAHIKTDSIKIPDFTPEIVDFVIEFGKKYGYNFEIESVYDRMCLVNNAVYIARKAQTDSFAHINSLWEAVGAQFQQPYVFKYLFSKQPIEFRDLCETKSVTTSIYLDMNERFDDDEEHDYKFVGRIGVFCPILPNNGGGVLLRKKDDNYHAVTGTKGYRWLESNVVETNKLYDCIDMRYFEEQVTSAIKDISQYGDFDRFVSKEPINVINIESYIHGEDTNIHSEVQRAG